MEWYVVLTKPKWELKVAQGLEKIGIEAYCPTVTELRQWSDRKKKVTCPLFRSYVFIKSDKSRRNQVFEIHGVLRYLFWLNKPAIVRNEEIETIKSWLNNEDYEDINTENISPGDQLTIANGDFKGREAVITEIGKKRARLILPSMGCVVNVKIKDVLGD